MKKLIIILFLSPVFLKAQKQAYLESNWGICYYDFEAVMPGTSFLIGKTMDFNNRFIDMQIGLALPTGVTAKIGIGKYFNDKKNQILVLGLDHGLYMVMLN